MHPANFLLNNNWLILFWLTLNIYLTLRIIFNFIINSDKFLLCFMRSLFTLWLMNDLLNLWNYFLILRWGKSLLNFCSCSSKHLIKLFIVGRVSLFEDFLNRFLANNLCLVNYFFEETFKSTHKPSPSLIISLLLLLLLRLLLNYFNRSLLLWWDFKNLRCVIISS